jgi:5-methyltetrahydrofolate--homocysteine methyltransferase
MAMFKTLDALTRAGLRDWVHVLVGGAPVTAEFAERVGADGYAPDAKSAVRLTRRQVEGASADLSGWRRKEPLHG